MSDRAATGLARLLDRALRELGRAGDRESACRIAADAWALCDEPLPAEARRFNGTLHYLARLPEPRARGLPARPGPAPGS